VYNINNLARSDSFYINFYINAIWKFNLYKYEFLQYLQNFMSLLLIYSLNSKQFDYSRLFLVVKSHFIS